MIVEPIGRNTAPAVAVAAHVAAEGGEDPLLLVMPADHLVSDVEAFLEAVTTGFDAAASGDLVTFGIKATYPATGYGYIRAPGPDRVRPVAEFVEKPDAATAERFLATGDYLWNSGMFLFGADRYLAELRRHAPEVGRAAADAAAHATRTDDGSIRLPEAAFAASPSISIDYAVMEQTDSAVVVSLDAGWSDIGSWNSILEVSSGDAAGNVLIGNVIVQNSEHSYIRTDGPLVAVAGVNDLVVVATPDAVLVTDRTHSEAVRQLVDLIRDTHRPEGEISVRRHRPWGEATVLTRGEGTIVDRVDVAPGETLTAAPGTWLVLEGTARHPGGAIGTGGSLVVPEGSAPTLTNPGTGTLVMVAVTASGA
jgi:mannose-1-phosphate guanylyltransferase/mannose-6-phosphate isomerase